jgi:hypothetical protein
VNAIALPGFSVEAFERGEIDPETGSLGLEERGQARMDNAPGPFWRC